MREKSIIAGINLLLAILLSALFRIFLEPEERRIRQKPSFDVREAFVIVVAALALTYLLSSLTFSVISDAMIFACLLVFLPYALMNHRKRVETEKQFQEIIIYCHNMAMLLKQDRQVYTALQRCLQDVEGVFQKDLQVLLEALEEGKEECREIMKDIEKKYDYSCLKNLHVIMLTMFYENSSIDEALLDSFGDDIEALDREVSLNRTRRKTLRMQYFLITAGSLFSFWFLLNQIRESFSEELDSPGFILVNTAYLFSTLLALFVVDTYFNRNITKE